MSTGYIAPEGTRTRSRASHGHHHQWLRLSAGVLLVFAVVGLLSACSSPSTPAATPTTQVTPSPPSAALTHIKVYFSQFPVSTQSDFSAVFPVDRIVTTSAVETFSMQLLIAGPTPDERKTGYFSELNSVLSGASSCSAPYPTGGPDFILTLGLHGTINQALAATLRFCRATSSPGVGADARIVSEITATLTQFPTIKQVVILTQSGHCFGDESGQDRCL